MNKFNWIISYDVRDPKRLRKVAKFMEGYGERLQLSLFCYASTKTGHFVVENKVDF